MKTIKTLTSSLLIILLLSGCGAAKGELPEEPKVYTIPDFPDTVEALMDNMSLEEKVAQLFIVRPEALSGEYVSKTEMTPAMKTAIVNIRPGGVIFFADNIKNEEQLKKFTKNLQLYSRIPMFISVDEEGGSVSRVASNRNFDVERFKNMESIGATGDPENAAHVGEVLSSYLVPLGFNLDFAPVADANTNPANRVIGKRAFSADPAVVSSMVGAQLEAMHSGGLMGCIKHFPGHGDTSSDTHSGKVCIKKDWAQLLEGELIPFIENLENTDMVMVSHITAENIDTSGLPASLSPVMIGEKLRGELGFGGVVITDGCEMGAVSKYYSPAEIAVLAVKAGADIVLIPTDFYKAYEGLLAAVLSGEIPESRIDESVERILRLKEKYNMLPVFE